MAALGHAVLRAPLSARARRRVGGLMVGAAAAGLVVALLVVVIGWRVVGQVDRDSRRSLDVTVESLDSLEQTLVVGQSVLDGTADTLADVRAGIDATLASFDTSDALVGSVGDLAGTLAPSLARTAATLRDLEDVGTAIDTVLRGLSAVPLVPSYRPEQGLGETFGAIADDIEPIPAALQSTVDDLEALQGSTGDVRTQLAAVSASIAEVTTALDGTDALLASYRTSVADARTIADAARADLGGNVVLTRLLVVLGGLVFAVGQLVPWWVGRGLLVDGRPAELQPAS